MCNEKYLKEIGVNVFAAKSGKSLNLTNLDLSINIIEVLHEDQFIDLIELSDLYLNNNNIIYIGVGVFRNNTKLEFIYLEHNNIEKFDFNLNRLPKLDYLIINDNRLSTLKESVFMYFLVEDKGRNKTFQRKLDVENNLFTCDCSMTWIRLIKVHIVFYFNWKHTCTSDISGNISLQCFMNIMPRSYKYNDSCLNNFDKCITPENHNIR